MAAPLPLVLLQSSVSCQVVLGGVRSEGVGVLVIRVFAAVVSGGLAGQGDACVVVGVDRLAEVNGVFQLLLQHLFTRVPGQLQQEETRVGLWQEVVGGVVLIQHLRTDRMLLGLWMDGYFCVKRLRRLWMTGCGFLCWTISWMAAVTWGLHWLPGNLSDDSKSLFPAHDLL